jgi:predicted Zn finger-like uncharacterized protein
MKTTCPDCRTTFHVTQAQLAVREGRVRCGRCAAVFDARLALRPDPAGPPRRSGAQAAHERPKAAAAAVAAAVASAPNAGGAAWESAPAALVPESSKGPRNALELTEPGPEFDVAEPARKRHWAAWAAGCFVLVLGLMAQAAFYYRSEIALLLPEARPVLAEICRRLDCNVSLPRRAEQVSIETSDLQADPANPGVMVLTATLRNRAAFPQSYPSLELTLTDSQDRALARRVLGVRDYLGRSAGAAAGFPANSEVPVKIYMEATSLKATGYRLYLFFP